MHCAAFHCLWMLGFGPDEAKPDRIGGYFDATDDGRLLLLWDPRRPDPREGPAVARFVADWLARRKARLVVYRGGKELREDRGPRRR